jgi:hypothetical protein
LFFFLKNNTSDRAELKRELDEKEQEAARNNKREKIDDEAMDPKKALQWYCLFRWFGLFYFLFFIKVDAEQS